MRDGDVALEVLDGLFGGDVALAVGLVDGDGGVVDLVADEQADGAVGHLAEHVENGELDGGDGDPDGEALGLVVVLVDGGRGDELLDVARVFADEEGRDALGEDGVEDFHLLRVRDGDAFVAVLGADAADVLLARCVRSSTRLDDDGICEELALEDGLLEDGVELGVALFECAGEAVARGVEELADGARVMRPLRRRR